MPSPKDRQTLDDLYSSIYEELRRLANNLRRGRDGSAVSSTTLVNEVWLKLSKNPELAGVSHLHFRRIAARAMRQVLVDLARRRSAAINGGGLLPVPLQDVYSPSSTTPGKDVLALHDALERLAGFSPRQAQLVEAHFFGGFEIAECASLYEISEATVKRDLRAARAWLKLEIPPPIRDLPTPSPLDGPGEE